MASMLGLRAAARVRPAAAASVRFASTHVRDTPRVIYRGAPYMRLFWFYVTGGGFLVAGINFATFVKDFLTWPLIRRDPENNPPKLAPPAFRYTAGGGIFVLSSLCSLYFFYAPSRMVTRITLFPHTQRLVLRTANPPPSRWLPKAVQRRAFFQRAGTVSSTDPRNREMQLDEVFRLQGSAVGAEVYQLSNLARQGVKLPQAAQALVAKSGPFIAKTDQQDAILLRVGDARLAFQLSAVPQRASLLGEPQPHGVRGAFHRMLRSPTDWGEPAGYVAPAAERAAHEERAKRRADTEPWFLDRAKFDRLFPLDRTRYRK